MEKDQVSYGLMRLSKETRTARECAVIFIESGDEKNQKCISSEMLSNSTRLKTKEKT